MLLGAYFAGAPYLAHVIGTSSPGFNVLSAILAPGCLLRVWRLLTENRDEREFS